MRVSMISLSASEKRAGPRRARAGAERGERDLVGAEEVLQARDDRPLAQEGLRVSENGGVRAAVPRRIGVRRRISICARESDRVIGRQNDQNALSFQQLMLASAAARPTSRTGAHLRQGQSLLPVTVLMIRLQRRASQPPVQRLFGLVGRCGWSVASADRLHLGELPGVRGASQRIRAVERNCDGLLDQEGLQQRDPGERVAGEERKLGPPRPGAKPAREPERAESAVIGTRRDYRSGRRFAAAIPPSFDCPSGTAASEASYSGSSTDC